MARGAIPGVSRGMADVLVVGAGPVGLAMAAELARHGCRCRKQDRLADTQILVNYRGTPWVVDASPGDGPRAGDRAPDAYGLRRGAGSAARDRVEAFARETNEGHGDLACVVAVATDDADAPGLIGVPLLRDREGAFRRAYGAGNEAVWVIRPDGYIGAHTTLSDRATIDAHFGRIVAGAGR